MSGDTKNYRTLFSQDKLDSLLPLERSNQFFEALFGDSDEGAYDIRLVFKEISPTRCCSNLNCTSALENAWHVI
jgi:hypothetical protein